MHAMRYSERKCLPLFGWECHGGQANKIRLFVREWDVARLAQVCGGSWAANRPVGGLGRTSIPRQKRLRGKIVKAHHGRQYKRGLSRVQQKGGAQHNNTTENNERGK